MKNEEVVTNTFGIVSFVLGLVSLAVPITGIFLAGLGLIFGIIQLVKGKNSWAIWGVILCVFGALFNLLLIMGLVSLLSEVATKVQELQSSGLLTQQLPQIPAQ